MTETEGDNSVEVSSDPQSTTEQTSDSTASHASSNKEETTASPEEVRTTEKVQGFINLEEEIARQERLKKLGLGENSKYGTCSIERGRLSSTLVNTT